MRILRAAAVFFILTAVFSCAGKPEISSEDASADIGEAAGDEVPPADEGTDITADSVRPDDSSGLSQTDPESAEKGEVPADRKKPGEKTSAAPTLVLEPPGENETPVPAQADLPSAGGRDFAEDVKNEPAEPAPVLSPVPRRDSPQESLQPISPENTQALSIPPQSVSPEKMSSPPAPVNPLLSAGQPVKTSSESEAGSASAPGKSPAQDGEPASAPAPAVQAAPSASASAAASGQLPPPVPLSEPLDDPAVSAAFPSRVLDEPGEFTITLEGQGWVFRSDLSSPGSWRFLERNLDGNSTHFRFMFTETGNWNLVFQRQDLSSGGSESAVRNVVVMDEDRGAQVNNGPLPAESENPIPGVMPSDAESRYAAASEAVSRGDISEALEFWEQDASGDDEAGRRARAALVKNAADTGTIGPLITWIPRYLDDNPDPETLAAALDAFEGLAGYDAQSLGILEELAKSDFGTRRPEWLYRLASYLEKPGPERNLDRAAYLYQEVITDWPLTDWRDRSEERLLWLQRHYFRVR